MTALPFASDATLDAPSRAGRRWLRWSKLRPIVLILNNKFDVVARHHLVYDIGNAERFTQWAVLSIEKNRNGKDGVDLEFQKRFDQGRFDAEGQGVKEQLVDERVFVE